MTNTMTRPHPDWPRDPYGAGPPKHIDNHPPPPQMNSHPSAIQLPSLTTMVQEPTSPHGHGYGPGHGSSPHQPQEPYHERRSSLAAQEYHHQPPRRPSYSSATGPYHHPPAAPEQSHHEPYYTSYAPQQRAAPPPPQEYAPSHHAPPSAMAAHHAQDRRPSQDTYGYSQPAYQQQQQYHAQHQPPPPAYQYQQHQQPTDWATADRNAEARQASKVAIPHTPQNLRPPTRQAAAPPAVPPMPEVASSSISPSRPAERVKIADLVSGSGAATTSPSETSPYSARTAVAALGSAATMLPPAPISTAPSPDNEYLIIVRQQPVSARSCGYGDRDRRTIDPPPIVELVINNKALTIEERSDRLNWPYYVVHCTIWSADGTEDCSRMPDDRQPRRLMGNLTASPFAGEDENGKQGCFFTFSDLSCRTPGQFRLKFNIVVLDPAQKKMGKSFPVRCSVLSDVFSVYPPKDFPGMVASTPLAHKLKDQGCLISIKKGRDGRDGRGGAAGGSSSKRGGDSSDDDDDMEGGRDRKRRNSRRA